MGSVRWTGVVWECGLIVGLRRVCGVRGRDAAKAGDCLVCVVVARHPATTDTLHGNISTLVVLA